MTITLRPASLGDEPFLRRLIGDTISLELGASSWPEPMRSHLLEMQLAGRRHAHRGSFPEAESRVIEADGTHAGWLLAAIMPGEIHIIEIMVAPELRGRGIGTAAMQEVLAGAADRSVRLTVNVTNIGAIRFYQRLGFRRTEGDAVQDVMVCERGQFQRV